MAFHTHHGHYEFKVMLFILCNASSTFPATMKDVLRPFLHQFTVVFFEDIFVYSPSLSSHIMHLESIISSLLHGQFLLRQSKCVFTQTQLQYLRHMVFVQGVTSYPAKIQVMVDWPTLTSPPTLKGFLGLIGFCQKLIQGYVAIVEPLTSLICKDQLSWHSEAQQVFDKLKELMTKALVLATPDFTIPFTLETNASSTSMGIVLFQNSHPLAYYRRVFCPRLQRASTYIHKLHVITSAVRKWRQYLLGYPFVIFTYHKSLRDLMPQVIQTSKQQTYLSKLFGYDYTIKYKSGTSNIVADALSRITAIESIQLFALYMPHFIFMDQLCQSFFTNPDYV